MKIKLLLLLLTMLSAYLLPYTYADMVVEHFISIEGAKIVSEGAYFYIEIKRSDNTNLPNLPVNFTLTTPIIPEEWLGKHESFFKANYYNASYVLFDDCIRLHFHAPYLKSGEPNRTVILYFRYEHLAVVGTYTSEIRFPIYIVSLKALPSGINPEITALQKEVKWWKNQAEYLANQPSLPPATGVMPSNPELQQAATVWGLIIFAICAISIGFWYFRNQRKLEEAKVNVAQ